MRSLLPGNMIRCRRPLPGCRSGRRLQRRARAAEGRLNPLIPEARSEPDGAHATTGCSSTWSTGLISGSWLQTTLDDLGKRKKPDGRFETAPIVRIPLEGDENFRFAVKQVLDMGAMGVVSPHRDARAGGRSHPLHALPAAARRQVAPSRPASAAGARPARNATGDFR